jgi:hypothetical protein
VITELLDVDEGRKLVERFRCGECQACLSVAWGGKWGLNSYVLRCGRDENHSTIAMDRRETMATGQQSRALVVTLTQALARVDEAQDAGLWPAQLTAPQKRLMAQATLAYGLDPLMQELTVYQGKPMVTIRGRRRKDAEAGHHPSIRFRFFTAEEKAGFTEAGAFKDGDLAMYAILTTEDGNTVEGVGTVTKTEREEMSRHRPTEKAHPVLATNPIEMCQKRAEDRARMMAYGPIPLPTGFLAQVLSEYQMGDADQAELPPGDAQQPPAGYFCADHNIPFQRHERDGSVWYSHRQGGGWHNMKESAEEAPPADEPFDPSKEPPLPLPEHVTAMTHLEAVLKDQGWTVERLQAEVLKTPLATYLRGHSLDQVYQLWKAHLTSGTR